MGVSKTWVGTIQRLQYYTLVNSLITSCSVIITGKRLLGAIVHIVCPRQHYCFRAV